MSKQFILVVYDISDDKRRTRLHNALKEGRTLKKRIRTEYEAITKKRNRIDLNQNLLSE